MSWQGLPSRNANSSMASIALSVEAKQKRREMGNIRDLLGFYTAVLLNIVNSLLIYKWTCLSQPGSPSVGQQ